LYFEIKETPFSFGEGRFFALKRAFLHTNETPPSFANNGFHSPLHYFPSVSDRWFGEGVRLSFICKQWFSLPSPFGEGAGERLLVGFVLRLFLFSLDYNKRGGESVI